MPRTVVFKKRTATEKSKSSPEYEFQLLKIFYNLKENLTIGGKKPKWKHRYVMQCGVYRILIWAALA